MGIVAEAVAAADKIENYDRGRVCDVSDSRAGVEANDVVSRRVSATDKIVS